MAPGVRSQEAKDIPKAALCMKSHSEARQVKRVLALIASMRTLEISLSELWAPQLVVIQRTDLLQIHT